MTVSEEFDFIIVGAGIAGSSLAYAISSKRPELKVLLLERDLSEPDRIVGELLQPGGLAALSRLGLSECVKGIDAIPNYGYGVFLESDGVQLTYPHWNKAVDSDEDKAEGVAFHHGRFIMKLREACLSLLGKTGLIVKEATVKDLVYCEDGTDKVVGVTCSQKQKDSGTSLESEYRGTITIVADGCFSKFRKTLAGSKDVLVRSHFVGAILEDCKLPMPNHGHVVLCDPSPVLLYQIGTHDTRILIDIPGKVPSASSGALKTYMEENVLPQLPSKQTKEALQSALDTQRLRVMPNSYLPASIQNKAGLILLGDALNMRHPLTGGGMTVAFNDVELLSGLLCSIDGKITAQHVPEVMSVFYNERKNHSSVINILAQALYELFSGKDWKMKELRNATVAYFLRGGKCADEPMMLLSGMEKNPVLLVYHFFMVAFYAFWLILLKNPFVDGKSNSLSKGSDLKVSSLEMEILQYSLLLLSFPYNLVRGIIVTVSAAMVILPLIWNELK